VRVALVALPAMAPFVVNSPVHDVLLYSLLDYRITRRSGAAPVAGAAPGWRR
jgi:hypothetical protein